ncbi:MAG: NAD(P)H-quinone oxidoreductase [Alphaproteobacteria bacterium]|nr:NAD(P)H-quinone oxidoreductase [Alphaproteobacteria bacterium]
MPGALPDSMTVIEIDRPGGPEVLMPRRQALPTPAAGEVLVRVAAAGVNYPDVRQRQGSYPPPPGASDIPGLEIAGTIVALGRPDTGTWRIGDRVTALVSGGGYAEYCAVPAPQCLPVPAGMDMITAAAIPETFFTAWTNLYDGGRLQRGETVLIHGGAGGVGSAAIQLAHSFGARVFTTAGTAEKCAACARIGADRAINYRTEDFVAVVKAETGGRGVDVVFDIVAGDYFARNLQLLATGGRLVQVSITQGGTVELPLWQVMSRRLVITGSTLRPRTVAEKAAIAGALHAAAWPLFDAGTIKPLVHKTFPLAKAAEAHALIEASGHIGNIVLET